MSVSNRFWLLLLALLGLTAASAMLGMLANLIPEAVWLNEVHYALSNGLTFSLAALLVLLVSIKSVAAVFKREASKSDNSKGEYVVLSNEHGEVRVTLAAIKSFASRIAMETSSVREAEVDVRVKRNEKNDALALDVKLIVGREAKINDLADVLTRNIEAKLAAVFAIESIPINIVITDVSDGRPVRKHRVV